MEKCRKCQNEIPENAKFCSHCGAKISSGPRAFVAPGKKYALGITLGSLVLVGLILTFQNQIIGNKPDETFSVEKHANTGKPETAYVNPNLIRLQKAVKASPQNKDAWKSLALELSRSLKAGEGDPRSLALDLVDALSQILQLDADDKEALLLTADLSFDMKAFTKAKEFYERYLKLEPDDPDATARYASTLTFLGQYNQSITLLNALLEKHPDSFQAHAFLAITYAQQGKQELARLSGEEALKHAPSEEARKRFETFLSGMGKKRQQAPLIAALQNNPIAGPKLVNTKVEGDTVIATMTMFPMEMMPEVAKQKFLSSLKANRGEFKKIIFIDQEKKTMLGEYKLDE